ALDREDVAPFDAREIYPASRHRARVDEHRTGAAQALATAVLGAGESELGAQGPEKVSASRDVERDRLPVQGEADHVRTSCLRRPADECRRIVRRSLGAGERRT